MVQLVRVAVPEAIKRTPPLYPASTLLAMVQLVTVGEDDVLAIANPLSFEVDPGIRARG
jgi:hypothetical protein